jgi:hypothetical protein
MANFGAVEGQAMLLDCGALKLSHTASWLVNIDIPCESAVKYAATMKVEGIHGVKQLNLATEEDLLRFGMLKFEMMTVMRASGRQTAAPVSLPTPSPTSSPTRPRGQWKQAVGEWAIRAALFAMACSLILPACANLAACANVSGS